MLAYLLIDPRLAPLRDDARFRRAGTTARRGVRGPPSGGAQAAATRRPYFRVHSVTWPPVAVRIQPTMSPAGLMSSA